MVMGPIVITASSDLIFIQPIVPRFMTPRAAASLKSELSILKGMVFTTREIAAASIISSGFSIAFKAIIESVLP